MSTTSQDRLGPDSEYRAFLAQGRFMLQRSRQTGRFFYYPRIAEPGTLAEEFEWVTACGEATVYSTTIVRNKRPVPDHNVALIDLAEGPRMMSRVVNVPPEEVKIGMKVRALMQSIEGSNAVVFEPVERQTP
ncbi:MAG: hypothetical protein JWO52_7494 [Gammaproteobacteria bacterium]|nr:hypothetical protein [Gammaproteobacteria bacterium]